MDDEGDEPDAGTGRRRFSRRSVLRASAFGAAIGVAGFAGGRATVAGAEIPGRRFRYVLPMWQDPATGALPVLYAATSPQAGGGGYCGPAGFQELRGRPRTTIVPENARDPELAATYWDVLEHLGDVSFDRSSAS